MTCYLYFVIIIRVHLTDRPVKGSRRTKTAQQYETRKKNNLIRCSTYLDLVKHYILESNGDSQKEREKHILPKSFYANVTNFLLWLISRRRNSVRLGSFRRRSAQDHHTDWQSFHFLSEDVADGVDSCAWRNIRNSLYINVNPKLYVDVIATHKMYS